MMCIENECRTADDYLSLAPKEPTSDEDHGRVYQFIHFEYLNLPSVFFAFPKTVELKR